MRSLVPGRLVQLAARSLDRENTSSAGGVPQDRATAARSAASVAGRSPSQTTSPDSSRTRTATAMTLEKA